MKQYLMKVPNGKLLKVNLNIKDNKIEQLKILGDFFLYPEEAITKIEDSLIGIKKDKLLSKIKDIIKKNSINILGFSAKNLNELIQKGFEDEMETNS